MKRSRLSYDEWNCILSKTQIIKYINNNGFKGYITQIDILDVSIPQIWKFNGEDIVVCQKGYKWLSILPSDDYYCITAMLNEENKFLLWYIDMIAGQGIDEDSIPYFDDLYLDLVVYPDGNIFEDDSDELEEAFKRGDITLEQFELANNTCIKLKEGLLSDINTFSMFTFECMNMLLS
jgi:predicted RNA-binding protein associated with RNAse of E/G family